MFYILLKKNSIQSNNIFLKNTEIPSSNKEEGKILIMAYTIQGT